MPRKPVVLLIALLFGSAVALSCAKAEPTPRPAIPENSAFRVLGAVAQESGWTMAELKAMETMQVQAEDREGNMRTYTGVSINTLLDYAQPNADATALQLKADYGYVVDVPLDKVRACDQCLVAFPEDGDKLLSVMPGFDPTARMEGLVRILVK